MNRPWGSLLTCLIIMFSLIMPHSILISNAAVQKNFVVNKAYNQYWEPVFNLAAPVTESSDYIIAPVYRMVELGTAYTASQDILDVIFFQMSILVKSKEYDIITGKYFYTVSLIDGKTLNMKWSHQFEYEPEQILIYDLNNDKISEVIITCANVTYVYSLVSGDLLWKYNFSEPILVAPLWDTDNDTLVELFVISQELYTDIFGLGLYYWKIWITDINTPENQTAYQWLRIPDVAWPYALAVGNWSLTSYYKVAVFYSYGPSITFIDPINLEVEKVLTLTSSWIYTESIVYDDKYLLFYDYTSDTDTYRVVNVFNETIAWTYQVKNEYPYTIRRAYLSNFDYDPNPEVLVLAGGDIAILNIATGTAISYLAGEYYQAIPLDINKDGLSEILTFEFLGKPRLFNNTLKLVSNITDYPEDIEWYPENVWPVVMDINQDTCYEIFFINSTSSVSLEVYSLREAVPPRLEVLSPTSNAIIRDVVVINCSAYDNESGILRIEIILDNASLMNITTPEHGHYYTYYWDTTSVKDGPHVLRIVAYDNAGNTESVEINVVVDNTSPVIRLITPENQSWLSGTVIIRVDVDDNTSGIGSVCFVIDVDKPTYVAYEDTEPPYEFTWDTTKFVEGSHNIMIVVYDKAGNWDVRFLVYFIDNTPPSLEILSPTENAYVRGIIKIDVSATDALSGISKVEFYIDGKLAQSDHESPYEYILDTTKLSDGMHTIKVIAYDLAGNSRSASITIYVDNTPPEILSVEYKRNPMSGQEVEVYVRVTDEVSGVKDVILTYSSDNGVTWYNITMQKIGGDTYYAKIPGHAAGTKIVFKVIAVDKLGNSIISSEYYYTVSWLREMMYGGIGLIIAIAVVVIFIKRR